MHEQDKMSENVRPVPVEDQPLEPVDAAKTVMLEAVEQFREMVAAPRPVERIGGQAEDSQEEPVDLNTASAEDLGRLRGIGPILAARIVDYRTTVRRFGEPADIVAVSGIGQGLYDSLAPRLAASSAEHEGRLPPILERELEAPESRAETTELEKAPPVEPEALSILEPDLEVERALPEATATPEPDLAELGFEEVPVLYPPAWDSSDSSLDGEVPWPDEAEIPELPPDEAKFEGVPPLEPEISEAWRAETVAPIWEVDVPDLGEVPIPVPEVAGPGIGELKAEEPPQPEPEPVDKGKDRPRPPEPPLVEVVPSSGGGCWRFLVLGVLSALAGAALALVALVFLNRTLDFRSQTNQAVRAEAARIDVQMDALNGEIGDVQAQLDAMRGLADRVEQIDAGLQRLTGDLEVFRAEMANLGEELGVAQSAIGELTGRANELGEQVRVLAEGMGSLASHLMEVSDHVRVLNEQVDAVRQATERFEAFLDGLRALLNEVRGPETPTPWPTALRPIPETPTPTPFAVTVIPPATPTP